MKLSLPSRVNLNKCPVICERSEHESYCAIEVKVKHFNVAVNCIENQLEFRTKDLY